MKEAIILAGGLGRRLSDTVTDRQKVMAPAGGRPFLAYVLKWLENKGFTRVILAVSYHSEQIEEYFGESFGKISLVYSRETEPLGTGGAIKKAFELSDAQELTIINGDTYFDADIEKMLSLYKEKNADVVLAAKKMPDCTRHSTLNIASDGKILRFSEKKPQAQGFINGGVYIVRRGVLDRIKEARFSFERDILEKMTEGLYALECDGYFIDMGIPEAYFRANTEIPLLFGERVFKAAFLDRDGVLCKEKHHLYRPEDFEFIEGVPEAIESLREMGYLIIVITNQAGVAKGLYTEEAVEILHKYMKELLGDKSHIDKIYYCPFHESASVEKYKKASPDRKPSDGMIQKAVRDFKETGIEIDLKQSLLAGDKLSDIECGIKAGVGKSFLLRSGHPIDENTTLPYAILDTLSDVVKFMKENGKNA